VNTVMLGSSWVAAQLAVSQEGLSSVREWRYVDTFLPSSAWLFYNNVYRKQT
jgi:hypothetical protein